MVVDLVLHPPTLEEEGGPRVEIHELRYTAPASAGEAAPDTLCIDSFSVNILVQRLDAFIENQVTGADYPVCFELIGPAPASTGGDGTTLFDMCITGEAGVLTSDLFMPSTLAGWNPLWYPYDSLDLRLELVANYRVLRDGQIVTEIDSSSGEPGRMQIQSLHLPATTRWQVTSSLEVPPERGALDFARYLRLDPAEPVDVRFARPLFNRIIFPLVLLVMLILVLLLSFIEGTVTFIEGALAVFLGVFGLTQVLLLSSTEVRTIVHLAIWGIYVALAGALLHHMFLQIRTAVDTLAPDDEDDQLVPAGQGNDTSARPEAEIGKG